MDTALKNLIMYLVTRLGHAKLRVVNVHRHSISISNPKMGSYSVSLFHSPSSLWHELPVHVFPDISILLSIKEQVGYVTISLMMSFSGN